MTSSDASCQAQDRDAAGVLAAVAAQIQTRDYSADLLVAAPSFISDSPQSPADQVTFFAPSEKYYNRIPQNIYLSS